MIKDKKVLFACCILLVAAVFLTIDWFGYEIPFFTEMFGKTHSQDSQTPKNILPDFKAQEIKENKEIEELTPEFRRTWNNLEQKLKVREKLKSLVGVDPKIKIRPAEYYLSYLKITTSDYLKKGHLPNFISGDLDCDGKPDMAFLSDNGVLVNMTSGGKKYIDEAWDSIELGSGNDANDDNYYTKCDSFTGIKFDSAARQYIFDRSDGEFHETQISD